jgi:S-adenosylmethionine-diacylglycerol 3-amino-3-carboxypropyl transferase
VTKKYFRELNYTLGNEDTSIDVEIIKGLNAKDVFSIAGCGSRSLPLLEQCDRIVLNDIGPYQLGLSRLRASLYRNVSFQDFLLFFDYPPYHSQDNSRRRKEIFYSLDLDIQDKDFFLGVFTEINWDSLLYHGRWEKTFQTLSKAIRIILKKEHDRIFNFYDLEGQKEYFYSTFSNLNWKALIFLLGNKSVFNALLYKGDFITKNYPESHFEYYRQSFENLFTHSLARKSFFAHLCFFGKIIHSDGNPIEAWESNFKAVQNKIKNAEHCVEMVQGNMVELLQSPLYQNQFDYLSLSDVPSYFHGQVEKNFLVDIAPALKKGGVVCMRHYLRRPECNIEGFEDITSEFGDLFLKEKVGVYRFELLRKVY